MTAEIELSHSRQSDRQPVTQTDEGSTICGEPKLDYVAGQQILFVFLL